MKEVKQKFDSEQFLQDNKILELRKIQQDHNKTLEKIYDANIGKRKNKEIDPTTT